VDPNDPLSVGNMQQNYSLYSQMAQPPPLPTSVYSSYYRNITEVLYYEQNDGEVFIYFDSLQGRKKLVTCIDVSSLFQEKKDKAFAIVDFLSQTKHANMVEIYQHYVVDNMLIFIEIEEPPNTYQWKTFCKRKFQPDEIFSIFRQITTGVEFLHGLNFTHRDVHPSRFQDFGNNRIKFNPVGLPYNFKKLLKRENFSGHINYSPPELILENSNFTSKVDVWALGCSLFYLIAKRDPFDGNDPKEIKNNILKLQTADLGFWQTILPEFRVLMQACFVASEADRPTCTELLVLIEAQ
jgi:serine/threonine protein kinase